MSDNKSVKMPEETPDLIEWHNSLAEIFLKKINIKENYNILDFGCGIGNYSIPIAKIISSDGKVFCLDRKQEVLDRIKAKAKEFGIEGRIKTIKTDGKLKIPLENEYIDLVLLYDVLGNIIYDKKDIGAIGQILEEIYRIMKIGGKLSVIMAHVEEWEISMEKIMNLFENSFKLQKKEEMKYLHWDELQFNQVYTYSKEN
ncbi:MAG: class I SAM-dependent methyltransferase [archaeon]|nr:class I SAM-dependent methyltransferase [archaeon]